MTKLAVAGVGSGFQLLLDFGCFHDELTDDQRNEEAREATAAAAPGATLLMMTWTPGRRGPLPRGASREDIQAAFPEWTLIDDQAMDLPPGAPSGPRAAALGDDDFHALGRPASSLLRSGRP